MGERFGKYELVRKLAVGGMAEIFLATHIGPEGFKKHVAIKRILPHLTEDQDFVTMFLDEARLVARFNHPNLVQIFELGQVKTNYFLAMEYVQGSSMSKVIKACRKKQIPFPLEYGAKILSNACEGLEYAHNFTNADGSTLNLIHRDVSPQNLMLSYDGVVKVLDFGIAKAVGNLYQTRTTSLKGKAAYMSPEQITQKMGMDRRSDVFSLGIVLYEFAVGQRPFDGNTELELMMSIVQSAAKDPRTVDPNIPEGLTRIVMTALQKDRRQRYQSAREMRADLEQFLMNRQVMVDSYTLGNFLREVLPQGEPLVGYSVPTPSRPSIADLAGSTERHTPSPTRQTPSPAKQEPSRPKTDRRPTPEIPEVEDAPTMLTPSEVIRPLVGADPKQVETVPRGTPLKKKTPAPSPKPASSKALQAAVVLGLVAVIGAGAAFLAFGGDNDTETVMDAGGVGNGIAGADEPRILPVDAGAVAVSPEPRPSPDAGAVAVADPVVDAGVVVAMADPGLRPADKGGKMGNGASLKKMKKKKRRKRRRVVEPTDSTPPPPPVSPDAGTKIAKVEDGSLMVYATPWANVSIDGTRYGTTPLDGPIKLKPGSHIVQLSNSSAGLKHNERVQILPGKRQTIRKKWGKGVLKIFVKPFGTVYIDGSSKGQTPLGDLSLYEGSHRLRVTCSRTGKEDNRTIVIEPGQTVTLKLDLR